MIDWQPNWWAFGDYASEQPCPSCNRERLLVCEDPTGKERVICEKCHWEPAINGYAPDVDPD